MLPDLHTGFSRGRSGGLVFPSLPEFSTVYCDPHSQRLWLVNKAEIDVFLEFSCFFDDPADVGNLISGSSAFSKTSLNITADGDCSHQIKRRLLLGRKVMTNLDSILKSRDTTLPTEVHLVKAMVFPVVMYGCESWTVKKAERQRIDAFEL